MMRSRRALRPVVLGGAATALLAGAAAAYASWSVPAPSVAVTLRTVGLPTGSMPVGKAAGPDVSLNWPPVTISAGVEVTGYRVIRSGEHGADHTVCATAATRCTDSKVPEGTWTYRVRPVQGTRWIGAAGPASDPVTIAHGGPPVRSPAAAEAPKPPEPQTTPTPTATAETSPGAPEPPTAPAETTPTATPAATTPLGTTPAETATAG